MRLTPCVTLTAALLLGAAAPAPADTSDKRIALSNNYAGNSWRQAMLRSWETVTSQAVEDGVVAAADAFTTAENQVTEQAAQIQNLILQGYDAIVLNAASPEGLNGAVKEACDAGIVVVSFDGIVTEPCAWRIAVDFHQMGKDEVLYLAEKMPEGGNLLEIRGLAGVFVDERRPHFRIHIVLVATALARPAFNEHLVAALHQQFSADRLQADSVLIAFDLGGNPNDHET